MTPPAAHDSPDPVLSDLLAGGRSILLVVDMQEDFCGSDGFVASLGLDTTPCRAIVDRLGRLVEATREAAVPVVWVYADYRDEAVPPSFLHRKALSGITRDCCVPGTQGYEPFGVAPEPDDRVFVKHNFSAMSVPALVDYLRRSKVETIVVTGVQTNVCVESTLRDAYNLGFNVVVVEDCVASHTPPLHDATLANVRALIGQVVAADAVEQVWRSKPGTVVSTAGARETEAERTRNTG